MSYFVFISGIYQIRSVCASKAEKEQKEKETQRKWRKYKGVAPTTKCGTCHPLGVWRPPSTWSVAPTTKERSGAYH